MTEEVFEDLIKKEFSWLIKKGFEIKRIDRIITFYKNFGDKVNAIEFSWAEYDVIKIHGILALTEFSKVEQIIASTLKGKRNFSIYTKCKLTIPKEFDSDSNGILLTDALYISNEKQVHQFSKFVRKFFENDVEQFFEEFSNINDVVNWLENNPITEHSNLLVLNQNTQMLRKLILLKEGNSAEFKNLYTRYRDSLKKKYESNESPYTKMYESFTKFDSYFTSS